jgi:hypothetical protein
MARSRSDEPKRVVRRLSDGTTSAYLYDRRSGEKVRQERIDNKPPAPTPGTFAALIAAYKATPHFQGLAPGTRGDYTATLNFIAERIGDVMIETVTPERVQAIKEKNAGRAVQGEQDPHLARASQSAGQWRASRARARARKISACIGIGGIDFL